MGELLAKFALVHQIQVHQVQASSASGVTYPVDGSPVNLTQVQPVLWTKVNMKPSRTVQDENCPFEIRFRIIESHFLRQMTYGRYSLPFASIKSIDIVTNATLIEAFEKKREDFKLRNSHEIIYAYHGTNAKVINQILHKNFDCRCNQVEFHTHPSTWTLCSVVFSNVHGTQ